MDLEAKLSHIAHLTDSNNHGGARWYIADLFPYLSLYKRRFELIDKLHEIDGSMDSDLAKYRSSVTSEMMDAIERKEGKELAEKVYNCL